MTYAQNSMIQLVVTSKRAKKSLRKVPHQVAVAFVFWRESVKEHRLEQIQKIPGYHDEGLSGRLRGLRSFRLSLGYRGFYRVVQNTIEFVMVEEVNKHDYKKIERIFD